jgi:hypothetical protein
MSSSTIIRPMVRRVTPRHRADYAIPLSDEWKAWHENNAACMSLPEFARFLDDHIVDVADPASVQFPDEATNGFVKLLGGPARIASPAKLVELTQGISIYEDSEVTQAANLSSGRDAAQHQQQAHWTPMVSR